MKDDKDYLDDWNNLHCKCVKENNKVGRNGKESADYRNGVMADYCEEMILKGKEAYYGTGNIIMTDQQYDKFENILKLLRPNSKILEKVGS